VEYEFGEISLKDQTCERRISLHGQIASQPDTGAKQRGDHLKGWSVRRSIAISIGALASAQLVL
jgi:hypothetical protein